MNPTILELAACKYGSTKSGLRTLTGGHFSSVFEFTQNGREFLAVLYGQALYDQIRAALEPRHAGGHVQSGIADGMVDLVVSDMAPNLSGIDSVDQARSIYLGELALDFVERSLQPAGDFAVKLFQGEGFDAFQRQVAARFAKTYVRKPEASRDLSREVFVVGKGFRGRGTTV